MLLCLVLLAFAAVHEQSVCSIGDDVSRRLSICSSGQQKGLSATCLAASDTMLLEAVTAREARQVLDVTKEFLLEVRSPMAVAQCTQGN